MKTIYFEFSEEIVEAGLMPSTLCAVFGRGGDASMFRVVELADRVYHMVGNKQVEIKNRYGACGEVFVSDEDKVVLKLRAVLLYK